MFGWFKRKPLGAAALARRYEKMNRKNPLAPLPSVDERTPTEPIDLPDLPGGCMGPDFNHYQGLADEIATDVCKLIRERLGVMEISPAAASEDGIGHLIRRMQNKLAADYAAEEIKLTAIIAEMAKIEACASF